MKSLTSSAQNAQFRPIAKARAPYAPLLVMGLGATLILGHGFLQDYAQALASPSGLYIPNERHIVPVGAPPGNYSHTFRIYNARPWTISFAARADCGCTGLSWEKTTIAAFGWKDITASMNVKAASSSVSITFRNQESTNIYLFAWIQKG